MGFRSLGVPFSGYIILRIKFFINQFLSNYRVEDKGLYSHFSI